MRSTAIVRTALCLFSLYASSGCIDDGSARHAGLHGTVRDAMNGARLNNVEVQFVSDTLDRASDKTNGDGEFSIDVGSMTLSGRLIASKAGYETRTVSVFLDDGDVTVDIELQRD